MKRVVALDRVLARSLGLAGAFACSIIGGIALVWRFITPEWASAVGVPHLLGMLGMLILPGVCVWLWVCRTEETLRIDAEITEEEPLLESLSPVLASVRPAAVEPPGRDDENAVHRHRRRARSSGARERL